MDTEQFRQELQKQIDNVFKQHPDMVDRRSQYPWLTGSLGDPFSGIWFVGENPSLKMVERANQNAPTEESQWNTSPGDGLFREALVKQGFKSGTTKSVGGWHCYITNVIKEADYVKHWRDKGEGALDQAADVWFPVLAWELAHSKPKLIVVMGGKAQKCIRNLAQKHSWKLPPIEHIKHYAFIHYPDRWGKKTDSERRSDYHEDMARIAQRFKELTQQ